MRKAILAALMMTLFLPNPARAQGYDGLFAAQDNYSEDAPRAAAPAQSYGGYDNVLAPAEGQSAAESDAYAGGYADSLGLTSASAADGTPVEGDDFYSLIVTGGMKSQNQIRDIQRQSLEDAKKNRLEETRRINAATKQQRDLARQEKARKLAELDRLRQEQAQKQAQERAQKR